MKLQEKIRNREARVGIIGLGYVGLPLVTMFARGGFTVTGFDIDEAKVKKLCAHESYIGHIPPEQITPLIGKGAFVPTTDFSLLREVDVILICVPTPLTPERTPDLSFVKKTAEEIVEHLRAGQLVVLESTTYPGTTHEVVKPILEKTGLVCSKDFFLAFSPEREDPGNKEYSTSKIPKVVGGEDAFALECAAELYESVVVGVVKVSSTQAAEAVKILENIYRCVNIALVNELKMLFDRMDMNIWEIIAAASTKPFGFQPFYPGPGLGGHCIPVDPFYLSWKARQYDFEARFIELAGEVNRAMPGYVLERTREALSGRGRAMKGAKILILGMAYKKNVDDIRESPVLDLLALLQNEGADVLYNDPYVPKIPPVRKYRLDLVSQELTETLLSGCDCVIITTAHDCYHYDWIVHNARLVIDTRGATYNLAECGDKIVRA